MSDRVPDQPQNNAATSGRSASVVDSSGRADQRTQQTIDSDRGVATPSYASILPPPSRNALELPPILQDARPNEANARSPAHRQASFSSILNPAIGQTEPDRRRKASHLESPLSPGRLLPSLVTNSTLPHTSYTTGAASSNETDRPGNVARPPRRILTPRSPSLHRAASLGQLNQATGSISAQLKPFPTSPQGRAYRIAPGTAGAPPLPTASSLNVAPSNASAHPYSGSARDRTSLEYSRTRKLSPSASPSTSYSSYSQTSQVSPAVQYASSALPGQYPSSTSAVEASGRGSTQYETSRDDADFQRPMGIPISSSGGPNVYQMMTLETTAGTVQLPVDVQAASRVADEKRRRNAGASARFRQRRKEKEREASTTISRLEQQVKEMTEDADFYRRERDYLAGVLSHVPGGERHFPRPTSPRHRRTSTTSLPGPSGLGSASFPGTYDPLTRSPDQGRNVRRRTSTMSLTGPSQSQLPAPGTPMQRPHAQNSLGGPLAPPPPPQPSLALSIASAPGSGAATNVALPTALDSAQRPPQLPGLPQILQNMQPWSPYNDSPYNMQDSNAPRDRR